MSIIEGKVQEQPLGRGGVEFQFSNPLVAGLRFALEHKQALFAFAIIPLLLELMIAEDQFRHALSDKVILFVHAPIIVLANAWQLAAVTMFAIQLGQGQTQSLIAIGISALQNLPKTLISYVVLIFVTGLGVVLAPLMCFVVFFIWAPLFCVGELFVPDSVNKGDDEHEFGGWDDDPAEPEQPRVFGRRSVLELGFGRSVGLASRNLAPTLQVAALFWFVSTVPGAIVALFFGAKISLACQLLQIIFTALATMLATGTVAAVFLDLLGKEARLELALPLETQTNGAVLGPYRRPLRFDRMFLMTMLLVSVAAIATWFQLCNSELQRVIPPDAAIEASGAVVEGDRIAVTLKLADPVTELRWLDPNQFVLSVGGPADVRDTRTGIGLELMRDLGGAPGGDGSKKEQLPAKQLSPLSRAYTFDADGKAIENSNFAPYSRPLKLVVYFNIPDIALPPKALVGDTADQKPVDSQIGQPGQSGAEPEFYPAEVYLYYSTYEGLGKPIFRGSLNLQAP